MVTVKLFASHSRSIGGSLVNELTTIGAQIDERECSPSKTSFSIDVSESMVELLQLRDLRYADEVYLKIYHNRMHPSKDHPDCPVVYEFSEETFRPHLTFWQLDGGVAATVVDLVDVHDGDIVLDMACDCAELTLEVLRNYDCFCIAMSPQIDQLAMAEVNWVGLQNHLKKEAGSRARHLQFIAVEFNKGNLVFWLFKEIEIHEQAYFDENDDSGDSTTVESSEE
uniref:Methyltransf_21 domain-containing protein n=1 Tax=Angiostrongylus cantonensis TaxID=6313 RepID=A0A0K0CSW5_ANGCA